ncbi:MAG: CDP-alcohol phosphatidyltransferase family protein [Candidatus Krumholzibacteria bacterium]|nr:CDP-alcohol phosphatidyltransferase family protein [Candidatus Krumholzibacteria bacterium]
MALAVCCAAVAVSGHARPAVALFLSTLPVIALFTSFALLERPLFRGPGGGAVSSFGPANALTALRIFLVPATVLMLAGGRLAEGSALYVTGALSDVADGIVARRRGCETLFGVMLDPVGDILSTFAVFTWLYLSGDVPGWLYVLLVARYVMFFGGLAGLALSGRLPRLRATPAGKAAGVVQGAGIVILLARRVFPGLVAEAPIDRVLIPALGAAFVAVIVSQAVIGVRAVRRDGLA